MSSNSLLLHFLRTPATAPTWSRSHRRFPQRRNQSNIPNFICERCFAVMRLQRLAARRSHLSRCLRDVITPAPYARASLSIRLLWQTVLIKRDRQRDGLGNITNLKWRAPAINLAAHRIQHAAVWLWRFMPRSRSLASASLLLWPHCVADAGIIFLSSGFFYLSIFFFPRLISAAAD